MLVLCYGITKSGSTLTFELVKGLLASAGYEQRRLSDEHVEKGHKINFVAGVLPKERFGALMDEIGRERKLAVKTHGSFKDSLFPWLEDLQRRRELQIIASYRDPRDMCLSLLDAGRRARKSGRKPFSEIGDLPTAIATIQRQLPKFYKWAALEGTLRLNYDLVAFSPDQALGLIEDALGVKGNREAAIKYAFNQAFTAKNKGAANRHEEEFDPIQREQLTQTFNSFIRLVYGTCDSGWFSEYRARILASLGLDPEEMTQVNKAGCVTLKPA